MSKHISALGFIKTSSAKLTVKGYDLMNKALNGDEVLV